MKGGSIPAWRKESRREAGILPWRKRGFRRARGEPVWPGVERPCPAGIWSERVEAVGGGWSYYLDACGRLGRRDERTRACSAVYLSCARLGASRPPQRVQVEATSRRVGWLHRSSRGAEQTRENLGDGQLLEGIGEMGGQNYPGAKVWLILVFGEPLKSVNESGRLLQE